MNKKGMLLASETLKIVIAAICIGFLIYLLAAIYYSSTNTVDVKEATARLEEIRNTIEAFDEGNLSGEIYSLTPNDWGLFSFNIDEDKKIPNECANTNCICFCEVISADVLDRQFKDCDEKNICYANERFLDFEDIEFEDGGKTSINISKEGQRIKVLAI